MFQLILVSAFFSRSCYRR